LWTICAVLDSRDHLFGFDADGEHALGAFLDGDDGRLVDDDAFAAHHHQGVGRAQVDADVQ